MVISSPNRKLIVWNRYKNLLLYRDLGIEFTARFIAERPSLEYPNGVFWHSCYLVDKINSMNIQSNELRGTCYGRDKLQGQLQSHYDAAASGDPRLVILLGATGMGKTRLAQELYRWLTIERDHGTSACPQGYWPDSFVDESLKNRVNPEFDNRPRPEIPFLWWGLQFVENAPPWETIQRALHWLGLHSIQVAQRRNIDATDRDGWYQLFGISITAAGLIPGLGTATNWVSLAKESFDAQRRNAHRLKIQTECESIRAASDRLNHKRVEDIIDTLGMFLDPKCSTAPTVPVVLFLDDAHWMDPTSLEIVQRVWTRAVESNWKLLIIATHWDDEWQHHLAIQVPTMLSRSPKKLAQFVERILFDSDTGSIEKISVCGVPRESLSDWILNVLPGLPEDQLHILLEKSRALGTNAGASVPSDGSPRVLEELLKMLLEGEDRFFVGGDHCQPLEPQAIQEVKDEIFDVADIVKRRFNRLSRDVQQALGWSSRQGIRFLNQINIAIAQNLGFNPEEVGQFERSIEQSEKKHCWIERISQQGIDFGRFNLCEFRSNVFCEIARKHSQPSYEEEKAIEDAIENTLTNWLLAGRFDCPEVVQDEDGSRLLIEQEDLTIAERRDALQMAIARFRPNGRNLTNQQWSRYGRALACLVQLDISGPKWGEPAFWLQAERTAIEFSLARPDGWPLSVVGFWTQESIVRFLYNVRDYERAAGLIRPLCSEVCDIANASVDREALQDSSAALSCLGDVEFAMADENAYDYFQASLAAAEKVCDKFGNSPENLAFCALPLERLCDVDIRKGDVDDAIEKVGQLIELRQRVVELVGPTIASVRPLCNALDLMGDLWSDLSELDNAMSSYLRAFDLRERMISQYEEAPERLGDLLCSLERIGDVESGRKCYDAGLVAFERALSVQRHQIEKFGALPNRIGYLAVFLHKVGKANHQLGHYDTAYDRYKEAADTALKLVNQGPVTYQDLRILHLTYDMIGDLYLSANQTDDAITFYVNGIEVKQLTIDVFNESRDTLRDLMVSEWKIANCNCLLGLTEEVLQHLDAAEGYLARLDSNKWVTPTVENDRRNIRKFKALVKQHNCPLPHNTDTLEGWSQQE